MDLTFTCPECGIVTPIEPEVVGQSGPCRNCDSIVTVIVNLPRLSPFRRPRANPKRELAWSCLLWLGVLGLVASVMAGFFLSSVRQGQQGALRQFSQSNLKQIYLAIFNYHDTYNQFPRPYYLTANGERTLSWRVAISPFLKYDHLLKQYRPDEPWNSRANLQAGSQRFGYFQGSWKDDFGTLETGYMVITGPGTVFEEGKDIRFADCTDDMATIILAVEVKGSGVQWSQPVDFDIRNMIFKVNGGAFGISSPWDEGVNVVFMDGSVRTLDSKTLESSLRAMITRNGGETVSLPERP